MLDMSTLNDSFIKRVRRVNMNMTQIRLYSIQIRKNSVRFVSCQILPTLIEINYKRVLRLKEKRGLKCKLAWSRVEE